MRFDCNSQSNSADAGLKFEAAASGVVWSVTRLVGAGVLAALAVGCTGTSGPSNGELGNGTFAYSCDSDSDPLCDGGALEPATLPEKVAVGARFTLVYTPSLFGDDPGGSTTVEAASPSILKQTETFGASFKGLKPGLCAVLARRGDVVTDFVHVRVSNIDHIQVDAVDRGEAITALEVSLGEAVGLRAFAVDETDAVLGGAMQASWTSSDEAVAAFDSLSTDNDVTVRAVGAGTATLRVDLEDQTREIEITVAGESAP